MDKASEKYCAACVYLFLVLTTFAVFWHVRNYDFVNLDDPKYVSNNARVLAGLTRDSISWAFTAGYAGNWHPLTWLSHMLDCQLFGPEPGWHHMTNLVLHLANTLLLFAVLKRMTNAIWPSAFVAAAFALHPLHVESVAWISERKDVLSTLFWMLTMAAYLRYVERPGIGRYLLTLLFFAMGLMAKPMLVTLPCVLLLLDYWPLNRFQLRETVEDAARRKSKSPNLVSQWKPLFHLIWEKVPFMALSAISSIVTFYVQRTAGAVMSVAKFPLLFRIANAFVSYLTYLKKTVWPDRLAVFYYTGTLSLWRAVAAVIVLLLISKWVIRLARSHKYLPVGWLWYLGTLLPVIGLVQVGDQALADRYTYVPSIGLFMIVAWGLPDLLAKWPYRKIVLGALATIVILVLSIFTRLQQRHWRNSVTLFEHTLSVTKDNYKAHFCLATALLRHNNLDEAAIHFNETLRIMPNNPEAHNNLGILLARKGELDGAITHYTEALGLKPDFAEAHNNLGLVFLQKGEFDEAIYRFTEALRIKPDYAEAQNNLYAARSRKRSFDKAGQPSIEP